VTVITDSAGQERIHKVVYSGPEHGRDIITEQLGRNFRVEMAAAICWASSSSRPSVSSARSSCCRMPRYFSMLQ